MKVLSLFDGMACGMLAFLKQEIEVERYVAYEIDKYAIQTSIHNFPMIEQRGDVFDADFTEFKGFDYVIGGSPCTYWSIAQKNNRETEASGMGWELFSQYVRAIKEAEPKYFIYENNKSMSKAIRESITETFGFEPICINSALLSAQNRQRLYWVGKRNPDGTYSKVEIEQPEDRGILLKDILEDGVVDKDKAYVLKHQAGNARDYFKKHHTQVKFEPVAINTTDGGDKSRTLMAGYYKYGTATLITNEGFKGGTTAVAEPVRIPEYGQEDKARPLNAYCANNCGGFEHRMFSDNPNKQQTDMIAEPVRVGALPRPNGELSESQAFRVYDVDGKSVTINAGGGGAGDKTGLYAVPVNTTEDGKSQTIKAQYYKNSIAKFFNDKSKGNCFGASGVIEIVPCYTIPSETDIVPFVENKLDKAVEKYGYIPEMWNPYNNAEITDKAPTQTAQCAGQTKSSTVMIITRTYPCEWDENGKPIKAISGADGKEYTVYEVKDGIITIKGVEYPIKLEDGFYIIRKLTVRECMRLQTVPEWYEFPVSDTQAYKMLGNGWTVDVIAYLMSHTAD